LKRVFIDENDPVAILTLLFPNIFGEVLQDDDDDDLNDYEDPPYSDSSSDEEEEEEEGDVEEQEGIMDEKIRQLFARASKFVSDEVWDAVYLPMAKRALHPKKNESLSEIDILKSEARQLLPPGNDLDTFIAQLQPYCDPNIAKLRQTAAKKEGVVADYLRKIASFLEDDAINQEYELRDEDDVSVALEEVFEEIDELDREGNKYLAMMREESLPRDILLMNRLKSLLASDFLTRYNPRDFSIVANDEVPHREALRELASVCCTKSQEWQVAVDALFGTKSHA